MVSEAAPYRARLIRSMTFLGGIYFLIYFLLPASSVTALGIEGVHNEISNGFIAIGAMALGLGIFNLVAAHSSKVAFRRKGWINSAALLVGMLSMFIISVCQWIQGVSVTREVRRLQIVPEFAQRIVEDEDTVVAAQNVVGRHVPPLDVRVAALTRYAADVLNETERYVATEGEPSDSRRVIADELSKARSEVELALRSANGLSWQLLGDSQREALRAITQSSTKAAGSYFVLRRIDRENSGVQKVYDLLFDGLFNQLGSAMFALLGVYIAAAAYRAFRIKTLESALMMTAAVVVMLGQISFGREIYEGMPAIRQWLLEVPNSAAFRAIRLGAGVAGLMLAIRMWLSIESRSFSGEKR